MTVFLFGNSANDVVGGPGSDEYHLNGGNDTILAGGGQDTIDGGDGVDLAKFSGAAGDYLGSRIGTGHYIIFGPDGYDDLQNIEFVQFGSDAPIAITDFVNPSNDTDFPIATVNNVQVTEGDSSTVSLVFTVHLSKPAGSSGASLMISTTGDGTGMPDTDFISFEDQVVGFAPGETNAQVSVTVLPDSLFELNETVFVRLSPDTSGGAGQAIPSPNQGQGTINDQDPMPTVIITPASANEGNSGTNGLGFTITLSEPAGTTIPITVTTTGVGTHTATVGVDYVAPGATASFPTGQTTGQVVVPIIGDMNLEDNETFEVVVTPTNPRDNVTVASSEATGTIVNDDQFLPTLAISDASVLEGNGGSPNLLDFTVTLSQVWATQVSAVAQTSHGTALAGQDYADTGSVIIFAPGVTTQHFTVPIFGDTAIEADETLTATLSNATNAVIGAQGSATGTILNDDQDGSGLSASIASTSVSEGNGGLRTATFAVDLSAAAPSQVTITATTVGGTAIAGDDFQAKTGDVIIAAGQTHGEFVVNLLPDQTLEADETFSVVLSNPTGGVAIATGTATGTIINDDQGTPLAINGLTIVDGSGSMAWWGGALGDSLAGGGGNDSLMGVGGSDVLDGGSGNDLLVGGLTAGDGADSLSGGDGNDTAMGGAGNDTILGGNGNDVLFGDAGDDTVFGGNDNDWIAGGSGNDYLWGEAGNDTIIGGSGNDLMVGGAGQDQLVADGGADTLTGGADADQFIYQGSGTDAIVITDFTPGSDTILLDSRLGLTAAQADAQTVASGANAVLSFAGGGSITFVGLAAHLGDLSAADFGIFA